MGRRSAVDQLDDKELDFVMKVLAAGATDRELSTAFEAEFNKPLAKSSIARWRAKGGDELKEKFRMARWVASQLKEDLKADGVANYELIIGDIEDRLLTATREVVNKDPVKALRITQQDQARRLKERALDIKEKDLELRRERQERDAALKTDRFQVAASFWQFILAGLLKLDPKSADALTKHSEELLGGFAKQLEG